jgi:DNA-binding LytR/AlgR family response regulator
MNCIIIDDDPIFQELLSQYLSKEEIQIKGKFENASLAISFLNKNEVDLIFLDLFMPEMTGHEFLDTIHPTPQVILTTSDPSFALESYKFNVVGYLVKPFTFASFKKAIDKVTSKMVKDSISFNESNQIFIKKGNALNSLLKKDILYIECVGDYANIFTEKEKLILHGSMKELENIFTEPEFIRVHRSYIIRLEKVKKIQDDIIEINGNPIPIGKTYKQELYKKLNIL